MAGLMEIVVVFYFPIFFLFLLFFFALLFLPPCHLTCCAAWSPAITRFGGWHCLLSSDVLDGGLVVAWWWNWMEWDERDEMRCDVIPRWLAWFGVDWIGLDWISGGVGWMWSDIMGGGVLPTTTLLLHYYYYTTTTTTTTTTTSNTTTNTNNY